MLAKGKIVIFIIMIIFFSAVVYTDINDATTNHNEKQVETNNRPSPPQNSTCYSCHTRLSGVIGDHISQPALDWEKSVHYSDKIIVMCSDCHGGNFSTNIITDAKTSSLGYQKNMGEQRQIEICGACHETEFNDFQKSIHWLQQDNTSRITCTDCHNTHDIKSIDNEESTVFSTNEPKTCGKCHEEVYKEYYKTFHGKQLNLGNKDVAVCSDCHNAHHIVPKSDPNSSINPSNLPNVCYSCHNNDFNIKVSDGIFHDNKESHNPNLLFDKDGLDDGKEFYYIGPFDLGFYIPFIFGALKVLVVFSLISIIFIETIFIKVFRRNRNG